jgi:hypothetical protein
MIQSLAVSRPCYVTENHTKFWRTTVAIDEAVLKAVGELSFDYTNIFSSHDLATFEVIKLKSDKHPQEGESPPKKSDKEGNKSPKADYDVQINITTLNHAVNPPVSVTVVVSAFLRCVLVWLAYPILQPRRVVQRYFNLSIHVFVFVYPLFQAGEIYVKRKEKGGGWRSWLKTTSRVPL